MKKAHFLLGLAFWKSKPKPLVTNDSRNQIPM